VYPVRLREFSGTLPSTILVPAELSPSETDLNLRRLGETDDSSDDSSLCTHAQMLDGILCQVQSYRRLTQLQLMSLPSSPTVGYAVTATPAGEDFHLQGN
jgi:hypothetical protein